MEDLLTSNVFGLLRYLPAEEGLLRLLSRAEDTASQRPLAQTFKHVDSVSYYFWPYWSEDGCENCQPDLLIHLKTSIGLILVAIEAKYGSGKSSVSDAHSERPQDQLAKEWDNLTRIDRDRAVSRYLIYVTSSIGIPKKEIEESLLEYRNKRPNDPKPPSILALSWRQVHETFAKDDSDIARDIVRLMERMDLRYYHGVHVPASRKWMWRFNAASANVLKWSQIKSTRVVTWSFQE